MVTKEQLETASTDRFGQLNFHYGKCSKTVGPRGGVTENVTRYRKSGMLKTWKTRPNDFRMPVKYGMRNHYYIDQGNCDQFHFASECDVSQY